VSKGHEHGLEHGPLEELKTSVPLEKEEQEATTTGKDFLHKYEQK
jgi:hypothetical protein